MQIYDFSVHDAKGEEVALADYKGKVLLIVNTASKCGFTGQYEGLESLYSELKDEGLEVLGFPCNQFGNQEPGGADAIEEFCQVNYGVHFKMFDKIEVNGSNTHPVFKYLKKQLGGTLGSRIKWNFTKFLIDKNGQPVKRFSPLTKPEHLTKDIEKIL